MTRHTWTLEDLRLVERVEAAARAFAPFASPLLAWEFEVPSGTSDGITITADALRTSVGRTSWRALPVRSAVVDLVRFHPDDAEGEAHRVGEVVEARYCRDGVVRGSLRFHDTDAGRVAYALVEAAYLLDAPLCGVSIAGTSTSVPNVVPSPPTAGRDLPDIRRSGRVAASLEVASLDLVTRPAFPGARITGPSRS